MAAGQGRGVVLGYLKYVLGFDSLAFEKGLGDADKRLKQAQKSLDKTAGKFKSIGTLLSVGLTAPLVAFGVASFDAAKDAAEMESAFDVSFGKASASVRKWAEETGNAMGRSTQEIQRGALAFQELFSKALDEKQAAEMSKTFAVLTQDLASFKNLSNEVAQQKLFSGLVGEAEPLRAVGVLLDEATVKAQALAMGFGAAGRELTQQEKVLARAAVIQKQLSNAQGDVIRTSGSAANQIKRTEAAFEELRVTVGTKLLPVITPLITKLADALDWFTRLPEPVQNVALVVGAVGAALGPVLIGIGGLVSAFGALLPVLTPVIAAVATFAAGIVSAAIPAIASLIVALSPILIPLAAVAAAVGAVYLAWKHWDQIVVIVRNLYNGVKTWLVDKLGGIFKWVNEQIELHKRVWFKLYDAVVGHSYIPDMVDAIGTHMARLQGNMVRPAEEAAEAAAQAFEDLERRVRPILDRLFPEGAERRMFEGDLKAIQDAVSSGILSPMGGAAAGGRLLEEADGLGGGLTGGIDWDRLQTEFVDGYKPILAANDNAARNFERTAQAIEGSLMGLVDSIRGGDFLDILSSVVDAFGALAGAGVFGGKLQSSFGGFRAMGGPVSSGTSYMVGERGPELFTPSRSGYIHPNAANNNRRPPIVQLVVEEGALFRPVVRGEAADVSVQTATGVRRAQVRRAGRQF